MGLFEEPGEMKFLKKLYKPVKSWIDKMDYSPCTFLIHYTFLVFLLFFFFFEMSQIWYFQSKCISKPEWASSSSAQTTSFLILIAQDGLKCWSRPALYSFAVHRVSFEAQTVEWNKIKWDKKLLCIKMAFLLIFLKMQNASVEFRQTQ